MGKLILCWVALAATVQAGAQVPTVTEIQTVSPSSNGQVFGSNSGTSENTGIKAGELNAQPLDSSNQIRALFPPHLPAGLSPPYVKVDGKASKTVSAFVSTSPSTHVSYGHGSVSAHPPDSFVPPRTVKTSPTASPLATSPVAKAIGNGIVYTCDATVNNLSATACNTLNTTIAALYSTAFTNANASIYITLGDVGLGQSNWVFNYQTYSSFRSALIASGTDAHDATAVADSVPAVNPYGNESVGLVNALQRALGFASPTGGLDAEGGDCNQPGTAGCYDGIITISNSQPLYFRIGEISSDQYDFFTVAEHETDEILGTASSCCGGSGSYVLPADYYRYHSDGARSFAYGTNDLCSSPDSTNACFSLDGVDMLQQYNNLNNQEDTGDWVINCAHQLVQDYALCAGIAGVDISPTAEILVLDVIGYTLVAPPPTVTTGAAGLVTATDATLYGTVNPNGADTNYWFLYGTNSSLAGASQSGTYSAGNGTTAASISGNAPGLSGGTTYYYQLQASNSGGTRSGSIASFSTLTAPPIAVSVSPDAGSGQSQTFTATYIDSNGASAITEAYILVGSVAYGVGSCWVQFNAGSNTYNLINDAGTEWSAPVGIGSGTASNSQCIFSGAGAGVSFSGNTLTVNFPIAFTASYAGTKNVYLYVQNATSNSGWSENGTWTVPAQSPCSVAVDRGGMWYVDSNHDFQYDVGDSSYAFGLGLAGAVPAVGPWHTPAPNWLGVFLNGTWYVDTNGSNAYTAGDASYSFGFPGAYPVVGDWTGSGVLRIGVFLNGVWYVDTNNDHIFDTGDQTLSYGITGDYPVLGDWTHTGTRKIGVYRGNGVWVVDSNGDNVFDEGDQYYNFGFTGAIPVVGDWTGDGVDKIGVFDPGSGNWYLDLNGNHVYDAGEGPFQFGLAGDLPGVICSAYN
jgi:hypothetical protein